MPFETTCPHCGCVHASMSDSALGAMVRCRDCFRPFTALPLAPAAEPQSGAQTAREPSQPEPEGLAVTLTETGVDLRPVVARLDEIRRKCNVLAAQHQELEELVPLLDALAHSLRVGVDPRGGTISLREAAIPIVPWERRLERLGLPALAREVAHLERTLAAADDAVVRRRPSASVPPAAVARPTETHLHAVAPPPPRSRALLVGLAAAIVVGMSVVAGMVLVARSPRARRVVSEPLAPTPPAKRPSPQAPPASTSPLEVPVSSELSPGALRELAETVSQARLALQRGDLDTAVDRLSRAARIDRDRSEVRGAAEEVVQGLVVRSGQEVEAQRWDRAEAVLDRARELAQLFELDQSAVEERLARLRTTERTVRLGPTDLEPLRKAIGRQVEVRSTRGDVLEATLVAVDGKLLVLEVRDRVGAGEVTYTKRVPLDTVAWVQYRYRP